MPITVKVIPIIPTKKPYLWRWNLFDKRIKSYMRGRLARRIVSELEKTTTGWRRKPTFVAKYDEPYGTRRRLSVMPFGRYKAKWGWIDQGTGPRQIAARGMVPMRFQRDYTPKTTPQGQYGGPGRSHGPKVRTYIVRGHRITPRNFSNRVAEKAAPVIERDIKRIAAQTFLRVSVTRS